jgi:hypothetical protein
MIPNQSSNPTAPAPTRPKTSTVAIRVSSKYQNRAAGEAGWGNGLMVEIKSEVRCTLGEVRCKLGVVGGSRGAEISRPPSRDPPKPITA